MSVSDLSERTRFSEPTISGRSPSPTKDLMNDLRCANPSIDRKLPQGLVMPDSVNTLLERLAKDFGDVIVQLGLKVRATFPYNDIPDVLMLGYPTGETVKGGSPKNTIPLGLYIQPARIDANA